MARRVGAAVLAAGLVLGSGVVWGAGPAEAAANMSQASWQLNDVRTATGDATMKDSVGSHDGRVGSDVFLTGTAFRFPFIKPNSGIFRPQHLVTVPDAPALNPGTGDWAVTMQFTTRNAFGNMIQKGQAGATGGYFKMQMPKGIVSCLFRGAAGSRSVNSGVALNDGLPHTIRCERVGTAVTMTIDGASVRRATGPTGLITNTEPLSIAGKTNCDGTTITCDYWVGTMEQISIDVGA